MKSRHTNHSIPVFDMQFVTSCISTTLVLLLLGLVVFFVLAAHNLSVYVKENINFSIVISDDMKERDILRMQHSLNREPFVKSTEYISKKQALKEQTEAMGTDPEEFLGYNPFSASIEVKLKSDYANADSIAKIEKYFRKNADIQEVLYQKDLVNAVNDNIRKISLLLLGLGAWNLFAPKSAWWLARGWWYKNAEPSDLAIAAYRIGGVCLLIAGVICAIAAL